ncbi:MAG: tRNA preQ1(34) S-adenosylmethionine ribosyltransferase-isomerase QueA [Candidatus Hydrothermarchaeaceae archaeon]
MFHTSSATLNISSSLYSNMLSDYEYPLPMELIAQRPLEARSSSRLMVLRRGRVEHRRFDELGELLGDGDVLVMNDTRVIPARMVGRKETGGRVVALLLEGDSAGWRCLLRGKNIRVGTGIYFGGHRAIVLAKENGRYLVEFEGDPIALMEEMGEMPTPPYIKERLREDERYQTVYSRSLGSLAAPTAGLHFTEDLLERIRGKGVELVTLTLHIGIGTFAPVRVEDPSQHRMEEEYYEISEESASAINRAKKDGRRVVFVGTSTMKAIESASNDDGVVGPGSGHSDLFIHPPYRFKFKTDGLLTNFHLPKSTLLMLVCAYAGRGRVLRAYEEAVRRGYRFFSFGDAMFIMGGSGGV